mgnify:CR=1 FL=1
MRQISIFIDELKHIRLAFQRENHTSTPPMQKRTTKRSRSQDDISLYSKIKKHEAMTTKKTADAVLISTTLLTPRPFGLVTSSDAS